MPAESEIRRRNEIHETRKTPLHHGNRPGSNRKRKTRCTPGDRYDKDAYNRAIRRAVEKANAARLDAAVKNGINPEDVQFIPRWHGNQLRHSVATSLHAKFGLEAVRTVLGHADPKITLVYAEADFSKAAEVMKAVG